MDDLFTEIEHQVKAWRQRVRQVLPNHLTALMAELHRVGRVLDVSYRDDGTIALTAHVPPQLQGKSRSTSLRKKPGWRGSVRSFARRCIADGKIPASVPLCQLDTMLTNRQTQQLAFTSKLSTRQNLLSLFSMRMICLIVSVCLGCAAASFAPATASTLEYYSFKHFTVADGVSPNGSLFKGIDGNGYGVTTQGGIANGGTVFKLSPSGAVTILHSFGDGTVPYDGLKPLSVMQASDGNLYGVTSKGGSGGEGIVFKLTTVGQLTILHHSASIQDPTNPVGTLVQVPDGSIYGVFNSGGPNFQGVIFRLATDGAYSTVKTFGNAVATDGSNPSGGLLLAKDGNLYGTMQGGSAGGGLIYSLSVTGTYTVVHNFSNAANNAEGTGPVGSLAEANGGFYGTCEFGGANGRGFTYGTVFKLAYSGTVTPLHSFGDGTLPADGVDPNGVAVGPGGVIYGTTNTGLHADSGTIYSVSPSGQYSVLHVFGPDTRPHEGIRSNGALTLAGDGYLYGVAPLGGLAGCGTIYRYRSDNPVETIYNFNRAGIHKDGAFPEAGLVMASDGNGYGVTSEGGGSKSIGWAPNLGCIYRITAEGKVTVLHTFADGTVSDDGETPLASMIQGSDGNLYGTTSAGGTAHRGTIFKISLTGTYAIVHSFSGKPSDGATPDTNLILASNGIVYGVTRTGGQNNTGVVYGLDHEGNYAVLHNFASTGGPLTTGCLAEGDDHKLYGTTSDGNNLLLFSLTTTGTYTLINPSPGLDSPSDLVKGPGGFYGVSPSGGTSGFGTVFKITETGTVTTLHNFSGTGGANPQGPLVLGSDGNLYGTTAFGGIYTQASVGYGGGTVFRIAPTKDFAVLRSFGADANDPNLPQAGVIEITPKTFVGTSYYGGDYGQGTIFEVTP